MGIISIHSHAFWVEECTSNILKSSHSYIQRIHASIFRSVPVLLDNIQSIERSCRGVKDNVGKMKAMPDILEN
jgi:hypothetical protein